MWKRYNLLLMKFEDFDQRTVFMAMLSVYLLPQIVLYACFLMMPEYEVGTGWAHEIFTAFYVLFAVAGTGFIFDVRRRIKHRLSLLMAGWVAFIPSVFFVSTILISEGPLYSFDYFIEVLFGFRVFYDAPML